MIDAGREDVRQLLADMSARTGLEFRDRHVDQLTETVARSAIAAGCSSLPEFRLRLQHSTGAFEDFIGELTVGETYFFRETEQVLFIRDHVLPDIVKRRGERHQCRVWSAGCASGEEPYSLSILLAEADISGRVLGTDISRRSLARAREARYRQWSMRRESGLSARQYLTQHGDEYVLDKRITKRVHFEYLNLAEDAYPSMVTDTWGMDLIFCRNVLIYFDRKTVATVCNRLCECLVPGGWLVLGASDPRATDFADLNTVAGTVASVYQRPADEPCATEPGSSNPMLDVKLYGENRPLDSSVPMSPNEPNRTHTRTAVPSDVNSPCDPRPAVEANDRHLPVGNNSKRVASATDGLDLLETAVAYVRRLANIDGVEAERSCAELVDRHRLSAELHYLHAVLLMHAERYDDALAQLRRVLFLDRSLAIAHFTQGSLLRRLGRTDESRRAFRNARQRSLAYKADESLPLGDGETAGQLQTAVDRELAVLSD